MKDLRGVYYYPFPMNKRVRMYVRKSPDGVEFRLWNEDDPQMWEQHGWVAFAAIEKARAMYRGGPFNPNVAYDLALARAAIEDEAD